MGGADHPRLVVGEQYRRAIGGEDAEQDSGLVGDQRIGMRALVVRPVARLDHCGRMHLVDGHQPCAGQDGGNRPPPVLGDRGAVVAAAPADVEAGNHAPRHATAAAEEAVGHARQRRCPDHLDPAHNGRRMTMSSSAWPPTMKA